MKLHTVFLRDGTILPDGTDLCQAPFCTGWKEATGTLVTQLDFGIRGAGWHFMWIAGSHTSRGMGRTPEGAIHRAMVRALNQVDEQFNAAELGAFKIGSWPGIKTAKVTLHVRHIQKQASLDRAEERHLRLLAAL